MKNKKILSLGILLFSLCLFGCNQKNENNENIQEVSEIIESSEVDVKLEQLKEVEFTDDMVVSEENLTSDDYLFYAVSSVYIQEFDRTYTLLGKCIDDMDTNDINYYFARLQKVIDSVERLNVSDNMKPAKEQVVNSLKTYKNGAITLHDAYMNMNYNDYVNFFNEMSKANEFNANFSIYCAPLESFVYYLSAFMETEFYIGNYDLYSMNSAFTDEENEILYILNHGVYSLSNSVDKAILDYYTGKGSHEEIDKIKNVIDTINSLEISNENLNKFREELSASLSAFVVYFEDFFTALEDNSILGEISKASEISKNAQRLYDSMLHMQLFYLEHNIDIDFSPTTDYVTMESNYELNVENDGSVEIIDESHTVVE